MKNLSKIKHIYRIYESNDKVLHCEKYPVIYINSEVVYFKDARKQEYLSYTYVKNVLHDFTEFYRTCYNRPCFNKFFWNVDENIKEIYEDLKKQREILISKNEEEKAYNRLELAKREYENAQRAVEIIESLKQQNNI